MSVFLHLRLIEMLRLLKRKWPHLISLSILNKILIRLPKVVSWHTTCKVEVQG
jgi:hypothetical protein